MPEAHDIAELLDEAERRGLQDAAPLARQLLAALREGESAEALNDLGTMLVKAQMRDLAARAYEASSALDPRFYKPLANRGNLLFERGEVDPAIELLRRASEMAPEQPRVWFNLANALGVAGELEQARRAYERCASIAPSWACLHNLGGILVRLGETGGAIDVYAAALRLDPRAFGSHLAYAEVLAIAERRDEAERAFRDAAAHAPRDPDVVAQIVRLLGRYYFEELGCEVALAALAARPGHETLLLLYVGLAEKVGKLAEAEAVVTRAQAVAEGPGPWLHLARIRARDKRFDDERELLEDALRRYPGHRAVRAQLARWHLRADGLDEALRLLEELAAEEASPDVLDVLAQARLAVGDAQGAVDMAYRTERDASGRVVRRCAKLMPLNYVDHLPPEEVAEIHKESAAFLDAFIPKLEQPARDRSPERRLRVGYLSPDFRNHPVGIFMEAILAAHDRSAVEIFCYSTTILPPSDLTRRIQAMDLTFVDLSHTSDRAVAERAAADAVDILVDLAGWTSETKLNVFRMKPAPIQVTYLGYPNTTGVPEIDYRITDAFADPEGADALYTERLVRLPRCAWAFRPHDELPPVEDRGEGAPMTFGSFNNLSKVSASTLDLWADVLHAVPGSRLLLKTFQLEQAAGRDRILRALEGRGIDLARIDLRPLTSTRREHLAQYGHVDLGLDTFPYNGTTTTCEALLMGVPVVSLRGGWPASRVGHSLLQAAGLGDLAVPTREAYVRVAAELAGDRARLRGMRLSLRDKVLASELGDVAGLARAMEAAYRRMWHAWVGA